MDKLYIVIPAYNEQDNIRKVINDWYPVVCKAGEGSRLLVIDDGSRDDTFKVLKEEADEKDRLTVKQKANSGHGPTILAGYKQALKEGADFVFQTDSDGQTNPNEFEAFWELRNKYDIIIGDRTERGDGFSRIVVTNVLKFVILLCFHVFVKDANTPYRLMKAETLKKEISYVPNDYFLSNVLLSVIYKKHHRKMKFIPISFLPRQGGVNSINPKKIFKIGIKSLVEFVKLNRIIEGR
ncbi:MAG: glycosyltransferase family 2 protein [Lachnospiraceae bacterium]|nr:glycosyltransferase family 2 protein [Lachnospiraceae bacterium]